MIGHLPRGSKISRENAMRICLVQPDSFGRIESYVRTTAKGLGFATATGRGPHALTFKENTRWGRFASGSRSFARQICGLPRDEIVTRRYIRFFQRKKPDIIIAQDRDTASMVVEASCRLGLPLVIQLTESVGLDSPSTIVLREFRKLFRRAAALITPSSQLFRQYVTWGAPPEKTHLIPPGIESSSPAQSSSRQPVFVSDSPFAADYAQHLLLLAFSEVVRFEPQARLHLFGVGPQLEFCRQLADRLRLGEHVRFFGNQNRHFVMQEFRQALAHVQHYVPGDPRSSFAAALELLEAAACELPSIATLNSEFPGIVRASETGFLVEVGDTYSIAQCMRQLLEQPQLSDRLGGNARAHVASQFTAERTQVLLRETIVKCAENRSETCSCSPSVLRPAA